MRYTLLELVQSVLRSMESDEVSDIHETQEAADVVDIIKECYFDIIGYSNLDEHEGIFKLTPSGDNTKPTLMLIPDEVSKIDWVKYNYSSLVKPEYSYVWYKSIPEFLQTQSGLDPNLVSTMTVEINGSNFVFKYFNDRAPSTYTIFDDRYLIFDSYDADVETTLTEERSLGYGSLVPTFTLSNSFVPDLDPRQFQLLLQDAKSTAHVELKQAQNPKAEQKYRYNRILTQKTAKDNDPNASRQKTYNFGRNPR